MYRSLSLVRESNDDLIVVITFSLLGLALSVLAIGRKYPLMPNIWSICSC
jgi:hypothetical protein